MGIFDRWRRSSNAPGETAETRSGASVDKKADIASALSGGQIDTARHLLDAELAQHPDDGDLLLLAAQARRRSGALQQAFAACEAALTRSQHPALVQRELAECFVASLDLPSAMDALEVAVALDPCLGPAWLRLGELKQRLDLPAQAIEPLEQAVAHCIGDDLIRAHHDLGRLFLRLGRLEAAYSQLRTCLEKDPRHVNALIALGDCRLMQDHEPEAIAHYQAALDLLPNKDPGILLNMAITQQQLGDLGSARRTFEHALALQPASFTVRWYLCQLDLLECRWREAWVNYPARVCMNPVHYRPLPFKRWTGDDIAQDTLLIVAGEGLGDEIMYASCIPDAMAKAKHCIIDCDPRLKPLFARSFPKASIVSSNRDDSGQWLAGLPTPQWQIPASDLPAFFRLDDSDFPSHHGYLKADPARVSAWKDRLDAEHGQALKIGISWRGGTSKTRTRTRTLEVEQWAPILAVPGTHFINLQYGDYQDELADFNQRYGNVITDYPEIHRDYDETAALVGAVDLVITVCTAIVHLSGALGRPVWILTPHSPAWRYTAHRQQMPWYPSSRIFRQPAWGNWTPACQELALALAKLT